MKALDLLELSSLFQNEPTQKGVRDEFITGRWLGIKGFKPAFFFSIKPHEPHLLQNKAVEGNPR